MCCFGYVMLTIVIRTFSSFIIIANDMTLNLDIINPSKKNRLAVLKQFIDFIRLHSYAKQLSECY